MLLDSKPAIVIVVVIIIVFVFFVIVILLTVQRIRKYFETICTGYTWKYALLQNGDVLVLNNQCMLHARREFSFQPGGQRHLLGCYTDAMDTTSHY